MAPDQQWLTQQLTENRLPQQKEVWRGGVTSGRRVGNVIPLFGQKIEQQRKKEKETHHGLKRPHTNQFSHNNQPKIGVHNRGKYGGEVRQAGGMWEM